MDIFDLVDSPETARMVHFVMEAPKASSCHILSAAYPSNSLLSVQSLGRW